MLEIKPEKRLTINEVLNHPWMKVKFIQNIAIMHVYTILINVF